MNRQAMKARVALLALSVALSVPLGAQLWSLGVALAQPEEELTAAERAVVIGKEAIGLFNEKRWADAHDKFAEADQVAHSPVFVIYMARSKRGLGELLAARALYQRVIDDKLPEDAPDPWRSAQTEAAGEKSALRIPRLRVAVIGPADAVVEIDGRMVTSSELSKPIEVDPGKHVIQATRPGAPSIQEEIDVEPGAERDVKLTFRDTPPKPRPQPQPVTPIEGDTKGSLVPGIVVLSLAGVAAIVGAVTGGLALDKASTVKDGCVDDDCTGANAAAGTELAEQRDDALTFAHVSTASLVIAGVAGAVGVVLIVVRPGGTEVRASATGLTLRGAF
jgi:hypothetical protein